MAKGLEVGTGSQPWGTAQGVRPMSFRHCLLWAPPPPPVLVWHRLTQGGFRSRADQRTRGKEASPVAAGGEAGPWLRGPGGFPLHSQTARPGDLFFRYSSPRLRALRNTHWPPLCSLDPETTLTHPSPLEQQRPMLRLPRCAGPRTTCPSPAQSVQEEAGEHREAGRVQGCGPGEKPAAASGRAGGEGAACRKPTVQ